MKVSSRKERVISGKAIMLLALLACPGISRAGDIFVDQTNPKANDKNTGTMAAPLKTIQAALDKAQPGDSVEVRAGVYHEGVTLKRGGSNSSGFILGTMNNVKWLTLEAYNDEPVILDGSVIIPADKWELVKDRKNTYCAPLVCEGGRATTKVWRDDAMLKLSSKETPAESARLRKPLTPTMPGDAPANEGWYYDKEQKKLYVNLGGRVPGKDAVVRATQLYIGIDAGNQSYVRIRKLEVRDFTVFGISVSGGHEFQVEDNYIHHCYAGVWSYPASRGVIRRNTISDIDACAASLSYAHGTIVEGNVMKRFNMDKWNPDSGAMTANCIVGLNIRNNVVIGDDSKVTGYGFWTDCGGFGVGLIGNTFSQLSNPGIYIEADAETMLARWNTVFDSSSGIVTRWNQTNTVLENYVFNNRREGLNIGTIDADNGRANVMMRNWVIDNGMWGSSIMDFKPGVSKIPANFFDYNVYKIPAASLLFQYDDKKYKDLAKLRAELGLETHGSVVDKFDPAPLGLVTFRVHDVTKSWKPMPMFGNPHGSRYVALPLEDGLLLGVRYFWKPGDFHGGRYKYVWDGGWSDTGNVGGDTLMRTGDDSGQIRSIYKKENKNFPCEKNDGLTCFQINATKDKNISADGFSLWSVDLPTADDAQIDLSLHVHAHDIKAVKPNGGLFVLAQFCNETGQNVTRQFLVGAEDGQKPVGTNWMTGNYDYKQIKGMVTAPKGARWIKLGFGLRNCSGWASFDDMDIQTRPGTPGAKASK